MELKNQKFYTKVLLKDVENIFMATIQEKRINFLLEMDKDLPDALIGDSLRIKQILTNLIGNSIKFTNKDGAIIVFVKANKILDKEI